MIVFLFCYDNIIGQYFIQEVEALKELLTGISFHALAFTLVDHDTLTSVYRSIKYVSSNTILLFLRNFSKTSEISYGMAQGNHISSLIAKASIVLRLDSPFHVLYFAHLSNVTNCKKKKNVLGLLVEVPRTLHIKLQLGFNHFFLRILHSAHLSKV